MLRSWLLVAAVLVTSYATINSLLAFLLPYPIPAYKEPASIA